MNLYLAGNIEWSSYHYQLIPKLFDKRLFSYHYVADKSCRGTRKELNIYLAVDGRGDGKVAPKEYAEKIFSFNKLISFNSNKEKDYLQLYLAGGETQSWQNAINLAGSKESLFSSYYLDKDNGVKAHSFMRNSSSTQKLIFIDSGGYSAFTKGVKIDIDKYCDFLLTNQSAITVYANLDVIGDSKASLANLRYMESKGLNPLPVFHYGEDIGFLKELVSEYKYIAVGGMVPIARNRPTLFKFLDSCYSVIGNKTKVHGFGMTGVPVLKRYPFYSADSTSWLGGGMRAEVYRFNYAKGSMECINTNEVKKSDYKSIKFTDNKDKRWLPRVINNAIEFQKLEEFITALWAKRGVIWHD